MDRYGALPDSRGDAPAACSSCKRDVAASARRSLVVTAAGSVVVAEGVPVLGPEVDLDAVVAGPASVIAIDAQP